ncbi:uncharacterized protein LOC134013763 [Osmerus eperlanus]|uniref:uncharacterized protein LOC134013763 n=1 Tax=Osmerus eperlanus TaxID=29151 RepID=UPI002E120359
MRPHPRPQTKRALPTIREGYEELVHDMNQANSLHTPTQPQAQPQFHPLSTQDYFRSICQLACPAFGQSVPDLDILTVGFLDSLGPCLRLHRPRETTPSPRQPLFQTATVPLQDEGPSQDCRAQRESRNQGRLASSLGESPTATRLHVPDPLEVLYGHGDALAARRSPQRRWRDAPPLGSEAQSRLRAESFPTMTCSSSQTQRKSSCPELCLKDTPPLEGRPMEERRDTAVPTLSWKPQGQPESAPCSGNGMSIRARTHTHAVPLDR